MLCPATGVLSDILPVSVALPAATGLPALRASAVQPDSAGLPGGSATCLARRATHSRRGGEFTFTLSLAPRMCEEVSLNELNNL